MILFSKLLCINKSKLVTKYAKIFTQLKNVMLKLMLININESTVH